MSDTFASSGLWFGGDYNPEQWGPAVWAEDDELMRVAGVTTATVGVFAWSSLEPEEGKFSFDWLDTVLDRLHDNGIRAVLATPTASPPPWFGLAHPDALPVTADGTRLWHGSRDTYCAVAPAYRRAALRITEELAARYAGHPALAMWHVHNEYGTLCHCAHTAAAFRRWLRARHGDLESLNAAWNTAFWSQGYATWDEIGPPRATQYLPNPGQVLDFARFWSDELLAAFTEQRDELRRHTPDVPVTTNVMLPNDYQNLDLWRWGRQVDVVSVDHYPNATGPARRPDLAFGADLTRSLNGGRPWLLMEQATSVVYLYDQGLIVPKAPGQMRSDSLGYVARGSDSVMFFQWRAGRGGAELHHSAMVPHAGPDTRVFREITELGSQVGQLGEVAGSVVRARVAVLWDVESWWALRTRGLPSSRLEYLPALREVHRALWEAGVTTDFAHPADDLIRYEAVFAMGQYLLDDVGAASLRDYAGDGGNLVVGCFSGVADGRHLVRQGGWPGGLLDVLGLRVEEVHPLLPGEAVRLGGGRGGTGGTGTLWSEDVRLAGAEPVLRYEDGVLVGKAAVTRHPYRSGTAWYLSTRPDRDTLGGLVQDVLDRAGVGPELPGGPTGVEAVRRYGADGRSWLFLFNHTASPVEVPATGFDLITGTEVTESLHLPPDGATVLREP